MPQFAYFDSTAPQPTPVIGWYDTDAIKYPNPPASADMLELTTDQWAARMDADWSVSGAQLVPTIAPIVVLSPAARARSILAAGLEVSSTSAPAINGTYGCGPDDISNIQAQMISIMDGQIFTNGLETRTWADAAGQPHEFTVPQFRAFARAVAVFVDACKTIIAANSGDVPAAQASIP